MRRNMKQGRDTERRPSHVCTPRYALKKARRGIKLTRWELAGVALDPCCAYEYALHIVKGRWREGEGSIRSSVYAVRYARDVVGGRWEECEEYVLRGSCSLVVEYASDILKGRWEEAEGKILEDYDSSEKYHRTVVRGCWPLFEERICSHLRGRVWDRWNKRSDIVFNYVKVVGGRVPLFEEVFGDRELASCMYRYAVGIGGRLPDDLHRKMIMLSFRDKGRRWSGGYVRFLESRKRIAERYLSEMDSSELEGLLHKFLVPS